MYICNNVYLLVCTTIAVFTPCTQERNNDNNKTIQTAKHTWRKLQLKE